ncbi:MAG: UDP-N-acetylmuramoyl-L-alanyl-D-glutamate--2,6-diaminopimelate ligase [Thermodesulfobacteriota bacterium]
MKLGELLAGLETLKRVGDPDTMIGGIAYDSRRVRPGDLFVALKGHSQDGHHYLREAIGRGAAAFVAEGLEVPADDVPAVLVGDSRRMLSLLATRFYGYPFWKVIFAGITGTNGKTTTAFLLESILKAAGAQPGVIGTVNYRFSGKVRPAPVTTPESLDLAALVAEMADGGVTHVIMEVSSHALDQGRTQDCPFVVGVFTNLSRDHLDYHGNMESYFRAKSLLFKGLGTIPSARPAAAVLNLDDPRGPDLARLTGARVISYGLHGKRDVRAESVQMSQDGVDLTLITPEGNRRVRSHLIGEFNLYNILAASAAASALGVDLNTIREGIETLSAVPGRMERVPNPQGLALVVDYAHTPDALQRALESLKPFVTGRLITVFGCGGDRDRGKRSEMGFVAGTRSDLVLITSDNPRGEDPLSIIREIEAGVRKAGLRKVEWTGGKADLPSGYLVEADRREAIRKAARLARGKDLVLIAGKGHEDYQIIGGARRHFDDREEAAAAASGVQ